MKKYILSLILSLLLVFSLVSCKFVEGAFKRGDTPTNNQPTTTKQGETKTYKITYHANGHGSKPNDINSAETLPDPLPKMSDNPLRCYGHYPWQGITAPLVPSLIRWRYGVSKTE